MTLKELQEQSNVLSDRMLSDLKYAFSNDCTDEMACRYAGVHRDTYYTWRKKSDEFCEYIDKAKDSRIMQALTIVGDKLREGDIDVAKWNLERRDKRRFSARQELTGEEGSAVNLKIGIMEDNGIQTDNKTSQTNPSTEEQAI
jgi:hypothetical protein